MTNSQTDAKWAAFEAAVTAGEIEGEAARVVVNAMPALGVPASNTGGLKFTSPCGRMVTFRDAT